VRIFIAGSISVPRNSSGKWAYISNVNPFKAIEIVGMR
jgi:hypothetical protein